MADITLSAGDDKDVRGTSADDTIRGLDGADEIYGGRTRSLIETGTGNDLLDGGSGNDVLYGQDGNDTLLGGVGDDQFDGGVGSDLIDGGDGNDRFLQRSADTFGSDTIIGGNGTDQLTFLGSDPNYTVTITYDQTGSGGTTSAWGAAATTTFSGIESFLTSAGADVVDARLASGGINVNTADGNDLVTGGAGADTISTGNGADSVVAGAGADSINAGDGDDSVLGQDGNDTLLGGAGNDTLGGGAGNDTIGGGIGDDSIYGDDAAPGSTTGGNDTISGDAGRDVIWAGGGDDRLSGGTENDTLYGEAGNDYLNGQAGDDSILGGDGNDLAYGLEGNDTILGGAGSDNLIGDNSAGSESATINGDDLIIGGLGGDHIDGNAGNDTLIAGTDTLGNGDGTGNEIFGGGGSDLIHGEGGNDTLFGDGFYATSAGDDVIYGHAGDDAILGDRTGWRLVEGAPVQGNDTLDGGDGNDTIAGEGGDDLMTGGAGFDVFVAGAGADTITDFTVEAVDLSNGDQSDNDFINLGDDRWVSILSGFANPDLALPPGWYPDPDTYLTSGGYYTDYTLVAWNEANGTNHANPLAWMRADFADDGVLNQPDGLNLTLQGVTDASQLTFDNTNVVCFAAGTLIETARGPIAVEDLDTGDLVVTRDNGLQPIRWIGSRLVSSATLHQNEKLRPIRIRRHALGNDLPSRDLLVSPQHRVLVRSVIAQKMFGTDEVLVAARQLCAVDGIDVDHAMTEVEYFHILFDRHEIVISNGAETESLYSGAEALKTVGEAAREEIFTLFPELRERHDMPAAARPLVPGRMGRKLADRHARNDKPLVG